LGSALFSCLLHPKTGRFSLLIIKLMIVSVIIPVMTQYAEYIVIVNPFATGLGVRLQFFIQP
jgi:hypothetical protein